MAEPLETDDAVVLLLGAPAEGSGAEGTVEGITRLEKLLFLFERETELADLLTEKADFHSHNFGPFSAKVYQAIDVLEAAGLVDDSTSIADSREDTWESEQVIGWEVDDPYATRNISLTDRGKRYYEALMAELPPGSDAKLTAFKTQFASLPLRQLIRYVYQKYPQFTDKSLIRDAVLGT